MDRRQMLRWLAASASAGGLAACGAAAPGPLPVTGPRAPAPGRPRGAGGPHAASPRRLPAPTPGAPQIIRQAASPTQQVALTVDDGFDPAAVAGYVAFAQHSGMHLTLLPNGVYHQAWEPHAGVLRPLIESGQVQIGNHTYNHFDSRRQTDAQLRTQIEVNEDWIRRTFATTSLPWFRPPYGSRDERTDAVAASLGFTRIALWSADLTDYLPISPLALLAALSRSLRPGAIVLGHANHPTITGLFGQLTDLVRERALQPATLDEMFGTSRARGT